MRFIAVILMFFTLPCAAVEIVLPFQVGGSSGLVAMMLKQGYEREGVPAVLNVKLGAQGVVGAEYLAAAPADGSVVGVVTTAVLSQVPPRNFATVHIVGDQVFILAAHPSVGGVNGALDSIRNRPRDVVFGFASFGQVDAFNALCAWVACAADRAVVAPYKTSAPLISDLQAGRINLTVGAAASLMPHIIAARVSAAAVLTESRAAFLPKIPSTAEVAPGFVYHSRIYVALPVSAEASVSQQHALLARKSLEGEQLFREPTYLQRVGAR